MEMVCASTALGVTKGTIQLRQKEGWEYKCKELLSCGQAIFMGAQVAERVPQFSYHIEVQEFNEKVVTETGEDYHVLDADGKPIISSTPIMQNTYRIVLQRHEEPNVEVVGHYWEIIEF